MGFSYIAIKCHELEDMLIIREFSLVNKLSYDIKEMIKKVSDNESFAVELVEVTRLLDFPYLESFKVESDFAFKKISLKSFVTMQKIFIELIRNSIAHCNEQNNLILKIKGIEENNCYTIYYSDNNQDNRKLNEVSILSGRGVGLIAIDEFLENSSISMLIDGDYNYKFSINN